MHRPTLGAITLALIIFGALVAIYAPQSTALRDGCWRVAFILGLLWLALPQLRLLPRWMFYTVGGALAVVVWRPKSILLVAPALVLVWMLRSRAKPRGQRGDS